MLETSGIHSARWDELCFTVTLILIMNYRAIIKSIPLGFREVINASLSIWLKFLFYCLFGFKEQFAE
jgi:hypothetical protein